MPVSNARIREHRPSQLIGRYEFLLDASGKESAGRTRIDEHARREHERGCCSMQVSDREYVCVDPPADVVHPHVQFDWSRHMRPARHKYMNAWPFPGTKAELLSRGECGERGWRTTVDERRTPPFRDRELSVVEYDRPADASPTPRAEMCAGFVLGPATGNQQWNG